MTGQHVPSRSEHQKEINNGQASERASWISLLRHGCSIDLEFLQVYGEEAHEGRYEAAPMPNQVTGICCECHTPLEPQIFAQICPRTRDKAEIPLKERI